MPVHLMGLASRLFIPVLLVAVAGGATIGSGGSFEPAPARGVASSAPWTLDPDTVRVRAIPGTPLILTLPSTLGTASIERYSLLQGPALTGVAGRSFTWIPQTAAPGTYEALLRAHRSEAEPDTLVVRIRLRS